MLSVRVSLFVACAAVLVSGQASRVFESRHAAEDIPPQTDPNSPFWRAAPAIIFNGDPFGKPVSGHRTEVRSRWTNQNLYFLFICNYEQLNLKPDPRTDIETNRLWNWDVAEVFIGSDFQNIRKYKEFEVSPKGEWVDLDINLNNPHHEDGWNWNSGFAVAARIDDRSKIWYACMRIPYSAVDAKAAGPGNTLRVNFYRAQGPSSSPKAIAWQPTHKQTYHVPEAFGTLKLE
ncbi:MAG: carbohydrate-binding family 9-like protein [Bryobacteraceae bacterium]